MGGKNRNASGEDMMEIVKKVHPSEKSEITKETEENKGCDLVQFQASPVERREKIAIAIRQLGLWNINQTKLSEELKVSRAQIQRDIKYLIKKIPKDELIETRKELLEFAKKSMSDLRKQIYHSDGEEKRKAIDRGIAIAKSLTETYESYGLKDKAAEIHKIEGVTKFHIVEKSVEEIKDAKLKRITSEPQADRDVKRS